MPVLNLLNLFKSEFVNIPDISKQIETIVNMTIEIYHTKISILEQKHQLLNIVMLFTNLIDAIIGILNSNNNVYKYLKSIELDIIYALVRSKCKTTTTYYFLNRLKKILVYY